MPKATTSQEKKPKASTTEEKETRKSMSKPKVETSYSKFVENAAKVSGKQENNGKAENKLFEGQENKDNTEKKEDENVLLTVQPEKKKTIRKK